MIQQQERGMHVMPCSRRCMGALMHEIQVKVLQQARVSLCDRVFIGLQRDEQLAQSSMMNVCMCCKSFTLQLLNAANSLLLYEPEDVLKNAKHQLAPSDSALMCMCEPAPAIPSVWGQAFCLPAVTADIGECSPLMDSLS